MKDKNENMNENLEARTQDEEQDTEGVDTNTDKEDFQETDSVKEQGDPMEEETDEKDVPSEAEPEAQELDEDEMNQENTPQAEEPQSNELPGKMKRLDKRIKILIVAAISILLITGIVLFASWMGKAKAYSQAEQLVAEREYGNALEVLQPLVEKEYKDSKTFTKYIKAIQQLDMAESSGLHQSFMETEIAFKALGNFKDSKKYIEYTIAAKDLRCAGAMTFSQLERLSDSFKKAGEIRGASTLSTFFKCLSDRKYDDAIKAAQQYKDNKGNLLNSKEIGLIARVNGFYSTSSDREQIDAKLGFLNVGFQLDQMQFNSLASGFTFTNVKSFKIKGLGQKPKGKVLVIVNTRNYKEKGKYDVNFSYTAMFGKKLFPKNLQEVKYIVKVYEKDTFKTWYTGGGKRVPGVTQSLYAELYNVKNKKVVARTQVKYGPALKLRYTYSGSPPDVIKPDWIKQDKVEKRLVREIVKKVPSKQSKGFAAIIPGIAPSVWGNLDSAKEFFLNINTHNKILLSYIGNKSLFT